jgi:hypothetical protein
MKTEKQSIKEQISETEEIIDKLKSLIQEHPETKEIQEPYLKQFKDKLQVLNDKLDELYKINNVNRIINMKITSCEECPYCQWLCLRKHQDDNYYDYSCCKEREYIDDIKAIADFCTLDKEE